jgi:hypothetical protein
MMIIWIIFLSLLVPIVSVAFWGIFKGKDLKVPKIEWSGPSWGWVAFILFLLLIIWKWDSNSSHDQVAESVTVHPEERRWELCWEEIEKDGSLDSECHKAEIVRYDSVVFTIKMFYSHHGIEQECLLNWDKVEDPQFGRWSQSAPSKDGAWWLEQKNDSLFTGIFIDLTDQTTGPMSLKAL